MKKGVRPVILALSAWFCLALAVGASGKFYHLSAAGVAIIVWGLTGLVLLVCWKIAAVRDWLVDVDLRALIGVHLSRFVGIYFLVLGARGSLPQGFARPAGVGDIAIATTALFILLIPHLLTFRWFLLIWNVLGLVDIVLVVFSALRFGLRDLQSMDPLRELPLSLLPTFIVPLIIASHILIFVRLRRRDR